MRSALLLVLVVACGGGGGTGVSGTPKPRVGDLGIDLPNLSAQLPPYIDTIGAGDPNRAFSGYVMVAQHDQVVWRGAYGLANRSKQTVPTGDTSFRIGSVTKQFTSAAILKLEQDGKLRVTDKVSQHLPSYAGPGKDVTLHHLLTHTSGIPSYTNDPAVLARKAEKVTPAQLLALFEDKPLEFEPGSKFTYSNSGYALLGVIIEKVSGMTYGAYLQQALFDPAGLVRTTYGDDPAAPDRAEGYQLAGEVVPADPIDLSVAFAAGGIRSTAMDMVRWHRALSGDRILNATQRAKLYVPLHDNYAYAWMAQPVRDRPTVWHNGAIDGFGTIYWRVPEADLVVIAWTNVLGVHVDQIGRAAVDAALGGKVEPIKPVEKGKLDPEIVKQISGTFELSADERAKQTRLPKELLDTIATMTITPNSDGVIMKPNGQSEVPLAPTADGSFFNADHRIRLVFDAAPGPINTVRIEQGPLKITYQRKP